ncbi:MAG: pentapeptide repeat-containing protein [Ardenticatenaceae bacterium]|nr:pentapeptide repeat-containing protein [Ardenticatenaceae bacterium]
MKRTAVSHLILSLILGFLAVGLVACSLAGADASASSAAAPVGQTEPDPTAVVTDDSEVESEAETIAAEENVESETAVPPTPTPAPQPCQTEETPMTSENIEAQLTGDKHFANQNLSGVDFSGKDLSGANFECANLTSANLTGVTLTHAILSRANLTEADLGNGKMTNNDECLPRQENEPSKLPNFSQFMLSGTNFTRVCLRGADFEGATLTYAQFIDANLAQANLSEANLSGAVLNRANLTQITMTKNSLLGTRLIATNFGNGFMAENKICLESEEDLLDFSAKNLSNTIFERICLRGANFEGANLDGAHFIESEMTSLEAISDVFSGAILENVNLGNGFMNEDKSCPTATSQLPSFKDANLSGAIFKLVCLRGANFEGATLTEAQFIESEMTSLATISSVFSGATLENVNLGDGFMNVDNICPEEHGELPSFKDAILSNVTFKRTCLRGADFSGATLSMTQFITSDLTSLATMPVMFANAKLVNVNLGDGYMQEDKTCLGEPGELPNFTAGNFSNTIFMQICLRGANFEDARLFGTDFITSDLTSLATISGVFSGVTLKNVNLGKGFMNEDKSCPTTTTQLPSFKDTDLSDVIFKRICLRGANFEGANLAGAHFIESEMTSLEVISGVFSGATLENVNLGNGFMDEDKSCSEENSELPSFEDVDLSRVIFNRICLHGQDFSGAILNQTTITNSDLSSSNFGDGQLTTDGKCPERPTAAQEADATNNLPNFTGANLSGTNFSQTCLRGAKFIGAELLNAHFIDADLTGSDFYNAYLYGAQFNNANLTDAKFFMSERPIFKENEDCSKSVGRESECLAYLIADAAFKLEAAGNAVDTLEHYEELLVIAKSERDNATEDSEEEAGEYVEDIEKALMEARGDAVTKTNEAITAAKLAISITNEIIENLTISPSDAVFSDPKPGEIDTKLDQIEAVLKELLGGIQTNLSETCAQNTKLTTLDNCLPGLPHADFTRAIITGTVFTNANMRGVTLTKVIGLSAANLSQTNLSGAALGSNLAGVNLAGANLGAGPGLNGKCVWDGRNNVMDLSGVNLSGANLSGVCLLNAQLIGADLSNANLAGADLTNANLYDADLKNAVFYIDNETATLKNAVLAYAKLNNADLYQVVLTGADLTHADFTDANLARATISLSTTLTNAIFKEVSFVCANLNGAQLVFVDISWADLRGADLTGADLSRSNLSGSNFSGAEYSASTRWPDFFNPLLSGAIDNAQFRDSMCSKPLPQTEDSDN